MTLYGTHFLLLPNLLQHEQGQNFRSRADPWGRADGLGPPQFFWLLVGPPKTSRERKRRKNYVCDEAIEPVHFNVINLS